MTLITPGTSQRKMTSLPLIEIVKRQAIATFSRVSTGSFDENLLKLKNSMNKITSSDVNLDTSLLKSDHRGEFSAPVAYIDVLDDPNLTIGIFVLKQGARLPLHDHPLMYGILKVVHGTVQIQSYSIVPNSTDEAKDTEKIHSHENSLRKVTVQPKDIGLTSETLHRPIVITARKEQSLFVNDKDDVCVLSPVNGNLHEIHSVNGPAAFLDVLSPPYSTDIPGVGPRPCRYFKELGDAESKSDQGDKRPLKKLLRIPSPPDYWSRSAPYQGP